MRVKLKNERWRPMFNRCMKAIRSLSGLLNDFPDHEEAEMWRLARDELRERAVFIKEDRRPFPESPHLKRWLEVRQCEADIEILEWNDRQIRASENK